MTAIMQSFGKFTVGRQRLQKFRPVQRRYTLQVVVRAVSRPDARTVLITGCSTGTGRSTAIRLRDEGWTVFAGARQTSTLDDIVSDGLIPIEVDVESDASMQRAVARVADMVGSRGLDGLVNNAGIGQMGPIEYMDPEEFSRVMNVNVTAGSTGGCIINIGSAAGSMATAFAAPYYASKHALEGLSDCMRRELATQGIRVVLVKPNQFKTNIWIKSITGVAAESESYPEGWENKYGRGLSKFVDSVRFAALDESLPMDTVTGAISRVLTQERPPARVLLGALSRLVWAIRFVPVAIMDKVLATATGPDPDAAKRIKQVQAELAKEYADTLKAD